MTSNQAKKSQHWYVIDQNGDFTIRINSSLSVSEQEDGLLSLENDSDQCPWLRFQVNSDNKLWVSVLNADYSLYIDEDKTSIQQQLIAGSKIQLPNNSLIISDHPFYYNPAKLLITVAPQSDEPNLDNSLEATTSTTLVTKQPATLKMHNLGIIMISVGALVLAFVASAKLTNNTPSHRTKNTTATIESHAPYVNTVDSYNQPDLTHHQFPLSAKTMASNK